MQTGVRSFIAIPLPAALQQRLGCLQQELKQELPELSLSAPQNLHLTLQFHGDQPQELLEKVGRLMLSIGRSHPPFSVTLKGLSSFPGGRRPRVVWLGVEPPAPLLALRAVLSAGLGELGLPGETHPYRAHLTLGACVGLRVRLEFWIGIKSGHTADWRSPALFCFAAS